MTRQALVEERIASVDEVEDAAIVADDGLDEELGLAPHRQPEVVLELRELVAVAREGFERAELQPLAAEVLGERTRLRIAQHPADLEREDLRVAQRPGVGGPPQLGVRHARPEEVRQARRQLVRRDAVRRGRGRDGAVALEAEEEVGRDEQRLDADREAFLERSFLFLCALGRA